MIQLRETNILQKTTEARSSHFIIEYLEFIFTVTLHIYFIIIKIKVTHNKGMFIYRIKIWDIGF